MKLCQKLTKFAPEFDIFSRFARLPSAKGFNKTKSRPNKGPPAKKGTTLGCLLSGPYTDCPRFTDRGGKDQTFQRFPKL